MKTGEIVWRNVKNKLLTLTVLVMLKAALLFCTVRFM